MKHNKKFLIVGHQNAISYKEIFKLIKENRIWLGYGFEKNAANFLTTYEDDGMACVSGVCWFTNLHVDKRCKSLSLGRKYSEMEYPKYDNYDAININRTKEIPMDYDGVMGVPITFMRKYNPDQFEIIGIDRYVEDNPNYGKRFKINGKETFARILIRRKN